MGGRFTLVLGALAAFVLSAACGGQSIRRADGDDASGTGGGGHAGSGARDAGGATGGTTSSGGNASSSGGTGARDNKPPPALGGATGAGATSGSGNDTGGTSAGGTTPASGGTTAAGGSGGGVAVGGGTSCADPTRIPLPPDATGWIDPSALCDTIGVQGSWYVFGDQYGDATCLKPGLHMPAECAVITTPDPFADAFPNVNGAMHTAGVVEQILPCPAGLMTSGCPSNDYANMWGAGIGFDLNADPAELGGARHVWNAAQSLVYGIEFTIKGAAFPPRLRVEFPMALTDEECAAASPPLPAGSTTDDLPIGAPYWEAQSGGDGTYPMSPASAGVNRLKWDEVQPPKLGYYTFDPSRLLGVRFHVPTTTSGNYSYDFTIANVVALRYIPLD